MAEALALCSGSFPTDRLALFFLKFTKAYSGSCFTLNVFSCSTSIQNAVSKSVVCVGGEGEEYCKLLSNHSLNWQHTLFPTATVKGNSSLSFTGSERCVEEL